MNFTIADQVFIDMEDILQYTFKNWGQAQADKYKAQLLETMDAIIADPAIGKRYPGAKKELKGKTSGKHIIFYQIMKDNIHIMRILHQSMDMNRHM